MPYVITEPCIGVVDGACVDVCPVDCIYEVEDQLVIHPDECIDCGACAVECPVKAIYYHADVPERWQKYIEKNAVAFVGTTPPVASSGRPRSQLDRIAQAGVVFAPAKDY